MNNPAETPSPTGPNDLHVGISQQILSYGVQTKEKKIMQLEQRHCPDTAYQVVLQAGRSISILMHWDSILMQTSSVCTGQIYGF